MKTQSLRELVNPTSRQDDFLQAVKTHTYTLYGGAAGGGKSYILRWTLVALLMRWAQLGLSGVRVGLFSRDYPTLRDRHITKINYEFPSWLGRLREQVHEFELSPRYGGGVIALRNLDDPSKYLSSEFAAIAVDELTENPEDVFNMLRMRLRWPGVDDPKFLAASNPGGIGHGWVKKLWHDRDFPPELEPFQDRFAYVPAKASDNPHLPANYEADVLASLPEHLRRAYREGDWNVFKGQFFTEWRDDVHTIKPFAIPAEWKRFASLDWGRNAPGALYWYAINHDKRVYVYRELYFGGKNAYDIAKEAVELTGDEHIDYCAADPAVWNKESKEGLHGESIADDFTAAGFPLRKADNDRLSGWERVHAFLSPAPDGKPWLQVFNTCHNLIRTLPALPHDDVRVEDVNTKAEDHAADSLRYGLMTRPIPDKLAVIRPFKKTEPDKLPFALQSEKPRVSWYDR